MHFKKINIISIISLILTLISIYFIIILNILPIKYLIPILIFLIVFQVLGIFLINKDKKVFKIIGIILLITMILGNIISIYHMNNINNFFNNTFKKENTQKIRYYVIKVKDDNKDKTINGDIGYYENSINVNQAIKKLNKDYKINDYNYDDIKNMFNSLNNNDIKYILLEKTNYHIITDLDEEINEDKYEIVLEFDILKKITTTKSSSKDTFNIYVGGNDYAGLMDFNTIISVNMKTHELLLTSIPRDTYVDVYGYDYKNKLSFITEGIDVSKNSIAQFFDIDIDYYIKIDAESVVNLIDEIGGITYCSDYDYSGVAQVHTNGYEKSVRYNIKKGCQTLNGYQAIAASRNRNSFNGRDRVRQQNMQKIIIAILEKLADKDNLIHYEDILNSLSDSYTTDIPRQLITKNVRDLINNGNKWNIKTQKIDGDDTMGSVHRFDYITDWILIPDMDTVQEATKNIKAVVGE